MKKKDNLILVGMPASGKSTVGVILAKLLGMDFIDTDLLIKNALDAIGGNTQYTEVDDDYLSDYFTEADWMDDTELRIALNQSEGSGYNINEVGVYHVKDGHASEMEDLLTNYLESAYEKNKTWYDSYIPEETPKLRDAEVKVFGNYVVYAILSESERNTFFTAIEDQLKQ